MFDIINFKCIYYFSEESFSSSMFLRRFLDVIDGRWRKLERKMSRQVELQVKKSRWLLPIVLLILWNLFSALIGNFLAHNHDNGS